MYVGMYVCLFIILHPTLALAVADKVREMVANGKAPSIEGVYLCIYAFIHGCLLWSLNYVT